GGLGPWLVLPLVLGGVSLNDVGMALMLDSASVLLAQAAALVATTIPRDWLKSVLLAQLFALFLLLTMLHVHGGIISKAARVGIPATLVPGTPRFWNSRYYVLWEITNPGMYGRGIIAQTRSLIELTTNGSIRESVRWYGRFGPVSVETNWGLLWTGLTPAGRAYWFRGVAGML